MHTCLLNKSQIGIIILRLLNKVVDKLLQDVKENYNHIYAQTDLSGHKSENHVETVVSSSG